MQPPSIFMRNVLSVIQLKCPLPGCAQIVTYDNFDKHISEWSFNTEMDVKCQKCNQLYKKREEQEHFLSCNPVMKEIVCDHFANHSPITKDWEHNIYNI